MGSAFHRLAQLELLLCAMAVSALPAVAQVQWKDYVNFRAGISTVPLGNAEGTWDLLFFDDLGTAFTANQVIRPGVQPIVGHAVFEFGNTDYDNIHGAFVLEFSVQPPTYLLVGIEAGYNFTFRNFILRPKAGLYYTNSSIIFGTYTNLSNGLQINGTQFLEPEIGIYFASNELTTRLGGEAVLLLSPKWGLVAGLNLQLAVINLGERLVFSEVRGDNGFTSVGISERLRLDNENVILSRGGQPVQSLDFRTTGVAATLAITYRLFK